MSIAHRAYEPNIPTWSIVWFAPVPRSSAGRSAVSRIIGVRDIAASTTAGKRFATAVPEVVTTTAGRPVAFADPRAKKADERSSTWTWMGIPPTRARASASGVEREPGERHATATPRLASSSISADAHASARSPSFGSGIPRPVEHEEVGFDPSWHEAATDRHQRVRRHVGCE